MIHLQRQVNKLKKQLINVGTLVEEAVHESINSIERRDPELAHRIIEGDKKIDLMEVDVEEECLHTLALHQPVAHDLRFVVAVLKINNDLERIGDLAKSIARQSLYLCEQSEIATMPFDLGGMSRIVETMLHKSLNAMVNIDVDEAREVRAMDDQVDAIHSGMYERVNGAMRENPHQIEQLTHLTNVSRQLERIADHAVNVAKDVLYMAEGEIVRHAKTRAEASGQV